MSATEGVKQYTYDEVFKSSTEYFGGDELAASTFADKYALRDNAGNLLEKTPADMHRRIAKEFARIEAKKFKKPLTEDEIFSYLDHFNEIVPQGSPMYAIGNPYQIVSLSNCYVLDPPLDSYGSILGVDEQMVQICKRRGGVGTDLSNLRPSGTPTHNAARTSTGIISFMERYSNSIREVGQSGRRGALMLSISVHHPEVLDFTSIKRDKTKVTGANLSVRLTDEFLKAVEKNTQYELRWPVDAREKGEKPLISTMVSAREVWDKIVENAHFMAEPGLLFWDNIIRESIPDCYVKFGYKTVSTNPCSEIPLCPLDSCRLLVVNLFGCVRDPFTEKARFDFDRLYHLAGIAQRLMDDLIDLELEAIDRILNKIKKDPEPRGVKRRELSLWRRVREKCAEGRRTGTGLTALGDSMAAVGVKYGSRKGINFARKVYRTLKLGAYRSSVDMAKEIGPFGIWNHDLEKKNPFIMRIKGEDPNLYADMKKHGRRNIALLTTAPTGSVSIMTQTTSGVEPLFMIGYTRRRKMDPKTDVNARIDFVDQNGDSWQEFKVYHHKVKMWMDITGEKNIKKSPWYKSCAEDLNWEMRIKLQSAAQRHIDHAISSTVNLPENVTVATIQKIYESAWKAGCKGITVYRKNCRTGVLVDKNDNPKVRPEIVHAPKRPAALESEVYHVTVKGDDYFVIVGVLEGVPYEVFAGKNGCIEKKVHKGKVSKLARGHYKAEFEDGSSFDNIADKVTEDQEAVTRLISLSLRHGNDIGFLVHQLEKVRGDMMSFSKAIARILKKYIPDGTEVKGEVCPGCGSENTMVRQEGCVLCKQCGASKCM